MRTCVQIYKQLKTLHKYSKIDRTYRLLKTINTNAFVFIKFILGFMQYVIIFTDVKHSYS